ILVLTARADEVDLVVGLDAGADDYVTKPFRLAELLARVRALLRRAGGELTDEDELSAQDVRVDVAAHRAFQGSRELHLTAKEFELLRVLVREAGSVVARDALMREVWGSDPTGSTKTLDMHVSWLRRKLGDDANDPRYITTVRGMGFRFETSQRAEATVRRRAVTMTLVAVTVAVLLLGVPLAIFGGLMIWDAERSTLELRTSSLARSVERRISNGEELDEAMLAPWIGGDVNLEARIVVLDHLGRRFVG